MKRQVIVVTGLPRSGTSLMMQMLAAADIPIQQDGNRKADASNERGYFEWERIKELPRDPGLIAECEGKAVKVISSLLMSLPGGFDYRVLFMERRVENVQASQSQMIERLGTRGGRLSAELMRRALELHFSQVHAWLDKQADTRVLKVSFESLLSETAKEALRVSGFLNLDTRRTTSMTGVVEPGLRHHGLP